MTWRTSRRAALRALLGASLASALSRPSHADAAQVGVVLMHGAGAGADSMEPFAHRLRGQGWQVANLDMPWGARGRFRQPVAQAEQAVEAAVLRLRERGARTLVLAGFSKGGLFAAHMAGRLQADALVAIAPNGGSEQKRLADELAKARALVDQGRGEAPTLLHDGGVTGGDDRYPLPDAVPSAYLSWFDPRGAMHFGRIWQRLRPGTPVLMVVPRRDLANLLAIKRPLFEGLPPHPAHRLYEPDTDHLGAVAASQEEVVRWIAQRARA